MVTEDEDPPEAEGDAGGMTGRMGPTAKYPTPPSRLNLRDRAGDLGCGCEPPGDMGGSSGAGGGGTASVPWSEVVVVAVAGLSLGLPDGLPLIVSKPLDRIG